MRLLITGGAGFIGSNFILYWLSKHPQDYVINYDKLTYAGNLENLKTIENNNHYLFIKGDICDPKTVDQYVRESDIIVHFAAESHVDRSIIDPSDFINTNIFGTYILLQSALKNKIKRFHHISTDEVYGSLELNDGNKFNENTAYNPRSPYAASKASSDHLVKAFYHTYGLPITISNCSNNFGPYQFPEKLIPLTIINLIYGKKVPVYGDGLNVRDWIFVEDHCRALDLIINKGKVGDTYCIGGTSEDFNNLYVVKRIIKIMGKDEKEIEFIKDRPGHDRKYAINWTKISDELGWKPEKNFDTQLELTVNWYKKNNIWWEKILNGDYLQYYKKQYGDAV